MAGNHSIKLLVCALLLSAFALHADDEEKTVTGTVQVEKDEEGAVTAITLTDGAGEAYQVVADENGKKLAGEEAGSKVEVKGVVKSEGDSKVLKVASYKKKEKEE